MTPQQIIGTGLRLIAVWLLVFQSPRYLAALPSALRQLPHMDEFIVWSYVIGCLFVIASVLLWLIPMMIAHTILPAKSHANRMHQPVFAWARLASILFGMVLFTINLISLSHRGFSLSLSHAYSGEVGDLHPDWYLPLIQSIAGLAFSLLLIFGSALFARLVAGPAANENNVVASS